MGDLTAVRSSEIEAAISTFNSQVQQLEGVLSAITGQVNQMASWQGNAHDSFEVAMQEWNHEVNNAHEVLGDINQRLQKFLQDVRILESTKF